MLVYMMDLAGDLDKKKIKTRFSELQSRWIMKNRFCQLYEIL